MLLLTSCFPIPTLAALHSSFRFARCWSLGPLCWLLQLWRRVLQSRPGTKSILVRDVGRTGRRHTRDLRLGIHETRLTLSPLAFRIRSAAASSILPLPMAVALAGWLVVRTQRWRGVNLAVALDIAAGRGGRIRPAEWCGCLTEDRTAAQTPNDALFTSRDRYTSNRSCDKGEVDAALWYNTAARKGGPRVVEAESEQEILSKQEAASTAHRTRLLAVPQP